MICWFSNGLSLMVEYLLCKGAKNPKQTIKTWHNEHVINEPCQKAFLSWWAEIRKPGHVSKESQNDSPSIDDVDSALKNEIMQQFHQTATRNINFSVFRVCRCPSLLKGIVCQWPVLPSVFVPVRLFRRQFWKLYPISRKGPYDLARMDSDSGQSEWARRLGDGSWISCDKANTQSQQWTPVTSDWADDIFLVSL